METHFEGSRGEDQQSSSHQRQYDEQNPENLNSQENESSDALDSTVNTDINHTKSGESLTNDESASTDPNKVANKPSFKNNN